MRLVHLLVAVQCLLFSLGLITLGAAGLLAANHLPPGVRLAAGGDAGFELFGALALVAGLICLAKSLWLFDREIRRTSVKQFLEMFEDTPPIYRPEPIEIIPPRPASPEDSTQPGRLDRSLDRLNDAVTELVLNCRPPAVPEGEFPSPDDNTPLLPLDRARFLAAMENRFAVAVIQIADTIERAQTVRELSAYNAQVGAILAGLHEDVLREVVRQQPPVVEPAVPASPAPSSRRRRRKAEPRPAEFPGAWAKKYRGMRAANR